MLIPPKSQKTNRASLKLFSFFFISGDHSVRPFSHMTLPPFWRFEAKAKLVVEMIVVNDYRRTFHYSKSMEKDSRSLIISIINNNVDSGYFKLQRRMILGKFLYQLQ